MQIKIIMSDKEKKIALIISVLLVIILYFINKRYLYILDAIFEEGKPKSVTLKTGFILTFKTLIPMQDGWEKKIKIYGNKISVKKTDDNFDIMINGRKLTTIYHDSYYTEKMILNGPTGRVKLS